MGCLIEDPQDSNTVYLSGALETTNYRYQMVMYKSTDAGETWPTEIPIGKLSNGFTICDTLAVYPGDSGVIYAGGTEDYFIRVYRTVDGGQNWKDATGNLGSWHSIYNYIYASWVSPDDPDSLIVGTSKGIFRTVDGGSSWNATTVTFRANGFAHHPVLGTLFASTEGGGVFRSEDQGATWQALNSGLGDLNVTDISLDAKNGWLYVGTGNASTWRLDVPAAPLWVGLDEIPKDTGGSVEFFIDAGAANAGRAYLLAGSAGGTEPGTPLPGGLATIPLNRDWLTNYILAHLNTSMFKAFSGRLDASGRAKASLNLPPVPAYGGTVMDYAYCLKNPYDFASNPVRVTIVE